MFILKGGLPFEQKFHFEFLDILVANTKEFFWNKVIKVKNSRMLIIESDKN